MRLALIVAVMAVLGGPAASAQGTDGTSLLRKVYDNYRASSSQTRVSMTIHRPEWERKMELSTWTRGDDDALVRFTTPHARVRGTVNA